MPDLSMSVILTRNQLGLSNLEINDHDNYFVAAQFMGATVAYNRSQVSSPFMDDQVTVFRTRGLVTEQIAVEVLAGTTDTQASLYANMQQLIAAFTQDSFDITIQVNGVQNQYRCEAADYQVVWAGPRQIAKQLQVVFSTPRRSVATVGF